MKQLFRLTMAIALLLTAGSALAVRVNSLYQTTVPVASQSIDERNKVLPIALGQVLIKVSGNVHVLENPKLKSYLSSVNDLIQEFSYATASGAKPYLLQLDFDPEGVDKILRDAGIATWGQNRPLILVWLEREVPGRPAEIVDNDANDDTLTFLKQNADRRGLAVIFPVMDVTDLSLVSPKDVANMAIPALTNAAKRYASDAILIGRLIRVPAGYNTQWKLVIGNDQWGWNINGPTVADVMTAMTDAVTDTLSARYASVVTNTVQTHVTLKIMGISQGDDVSQLMQYLKHLTPVADVQLAQVTGTQLVLDISLRGTLQSFSQAVSIGQKLTPLPSTDPSMLIYQWNH